jgi:alpha-galactosidase
MGAARRAISALDLEFGTGPDLRLTRYGLPGRPGWLDPVAASDLFGVRADGRWIAARSNGTALRGIEEIAAPAGSRHTIARLANGALEIALHVVAYDDSALIEQWVAIRNAGDATVRIDRIDSFALTIPAQNAEVMSYRSAWGLEFDETRRPLAGDIVLETRAGRSSKGEHPWFAILRDDGQTLSGSVMWSGNWVVRCEQIADGQFRLSGGLHDWEFFKDLAPGEECEGAHVALALGERADLNDISAQYARIGRRFWYPDNDLSRRLPVEWNHWFPYIDKHIDERVFKQNVDEAARMGLEVCTLDAGWFGPADPDTHWYDYRGDWDVVNTARFPGGIRALADDTHARGMKFGLWCEIEALGVNARAAETKPAIVARRDGEALGYVCLGSAAGRDHALATLERLITDYACDWIKLDFNLDPGAGCNRTDHGHGAGDGLYEHYRGYYALLAEIRRRHPEVVLENCSSGGLRIDLGIMRQTHLTFLSDPDWPEHDLQIFWGASTMLAPERCLHWGWCEWTNTTHPHQTLDLHDPKLTQDQLDYYVRNGMLGAFGYSQRLPDLPIWVRDRLAYHARQYKDVVRRFVREGTVHRLTAQPRREGEGDRWAAFQYALPDGVEHLLFVFRLDGGEPERTLQLQALDPDWQYEISSLAGGPSERQSGGDLMNAGIRFDTLPEEGSEILRLRQQPTRRPPLHHAEPQRSISPCA